MEGPDGVWGLEVDGKGVKIRLQRVSLRVSGWELRAQVLGLCHQVDGIPRGSCVLLVGLISRRLAAVAMKVYVLHL